jgi:hypothetical protein
MYRSDNTPHTPTPHRVWFLGDKYESGEEKRETYERTRKKDKRYSENLS